MLGDGMKWILLWWLSTTMVWASVMPQERLMVASTNEVRLHAPVEVTWGKDFTVIFSHPRLPAIDTLAFEQWSHWVAIEDVHLSVGRWRVKLLPRRAGELTLPQLTVTWDENNHPSGVTLPEVALTVLPGSVDVKVSAPPEQAWVGQVVAVDVWLETALPDLGLHHEPGRRYPKTVWHQWSDWHEDWQADGEVWRKHIRLAVMAKEPGSVSLPLGVLEVALPRGERLRYPLGSPSLRVKAVPFFAPALSGYAPLMLRLAKEPVLTQTLAQWHWHIPGLDWHLVSPNPRLQWHIQVDNGWFEPVQQWLKKRANRDDTRLQAPQCDVSAQVLTMASEAKRSMLRWQGQCLQTWMLSPWHWYDMEAMSRDDSSSWQPWQWLQSQPLQLMTQSLAIHRPQGQWLVVPVVVFWILSVGIGLLCLFGFWWFGKRWYQAFLRRWCRPNGRRWLLLARLSWHLRGVKDLAQLDTWRQDWSQSMVGHPHLSWEALLAMSSLQHWALPVASLSGCEQRPLSPEEIAQVLQIFKHKWFTHFWHRQHWRPRAC